jgi:hypothetical protein
MQGWVAGGGITSSTTIALRLQKLTKGKPLEIVKCPRAKSLFESALNWSRVISSNIGHDEADTLRHKR